MARPKKSATSKTVSCAYKIVEKNGKFILYHGDSVRHVFSTMTKAEEYLAWIMG